ncbi:MAG: enoyl-CoA hydratase-related protein [Pseudomonadales bacterium]
MKSTVITAASRQGILSITMNRPAVRNAFDDSQVLQLIAALEQAEADSGVRVVILAGAGTSFSAGGDIDYMRRMGENSYADNLVDAKRLAHLMRTLNFLSKPTIARVQGPAVGGGVGLACCCDFAVGSPAALFATSEVKLGMVAATIGPYVTATVGEKAARRMFLSALPVRASDALRLGLLSHLVPEEELDAEVESLASTLIQNAPQAMRRSKQLTFDMARRPISHELIDETVTLIADVRASGEGREGLEAFLNKRAPQWESAQGLPQSAKE